MERSELKAILEAMIFVADQPVDEKQLVAALEGTAVTLAEVSAALDEIAAAWNEHTSHGIALKQVAGGYQFRTKESLAPWIQRLHIPKTVRFSSAALETLAMIAYRQPCIRSEVEAIRGVDSGGVIKTLLERRLIKIVGRRDEAGQPLIYATTKDFLELFNLKDLSDLPALKDVEEFMRERRVATETADPENAPLPLEAQSGDKDDEDDDYPTEPLDDDFDDDDEEETDAILPDEEEDEGDDEDEEALESLEASLKNLKELEKHIPLDALTQGGESEEQQITNLEEGGAGQASGENSPPPPDRSVH